MKKCKSDHSFKACFAKKAIQEAIRFGASFPLPTPDPTIGYVGCAGAYNSGPAEDGPWQKESE